MPPPDPDQSAASPSETPATPPSSPSPAAIWLIPVAGPTTALDADELKLTTPGPITLGRSQQADVILQDATISRTHARLALAPGSSEPVWTLTDLGSTHGTLRNGTLLTPQQPVTLEPGDQLGFGPFLFRVQGERSETPSTLSVPAERNPQDRVEHVPSRELGPPAQQKLNLLIECAAQLNSAKDLHALAPIAAQIAAEGTGYRRAALVRPPNAQGEVEILAHTSSGLASENEAGGEKTGHGLHLSQSLLQQAARGQLVRLSSEQSSAGQTFGHSIVSLGIHSALCAPIRIGDSIDALLYLDARGSEDAVAVDAASFVQAVARILGLAMANLQRKRLEMDRAVMRAELQAARQAQHMIMPPSGTRSVGGVRYALETLAGQHVAGDLFDVFALGADPENPQPSDPVACLLGDVSGKGLAAAMTMAMVQTHLRAALRYHDGDPARAVCEVNDALFPRLTEGRFITLWLAVIHPNQRSFRYVDAGHGYALIKPPHGPAQPIETRGLFPIGIAPGAPYSNEEGHLAPGERLLLFSDGLVEQPDANRVQFGLDRILHVVESSPNAEQDVRLLRAAVQAHAGHRPLADDFTLASLELPG